MRQPRPKDLRPIVGAAIREVIKTGATDRAFVDALTERLAKVVDDLAVQTFLTWIGDSLEKMPDQQRKAIMFDVLMTMNPRVAGLLDLEMIAEKGEPG